MARAVANVEADRRASFPPVDAVRPESLERHAELATDHSNCRSHHPARDFEVSPPYLDVETGEQRAERAMGRPLMSGRNHHPPYVSDSSDGCDFDAARLLGRKQAGGQDDPTRRHRRRPIPADDVHGALVVCITFAERSELGSAPPSGRDHRIGTQPECRLRLVELVGDRESERGALHN